MPRYRMELEVEVVCPISKNDPKNTISAETVLESLLSTGKNSNGYPVCDRRNMAALTATMHIKKAKFLDASCEACGQALPTVSEPPPLTCGECGRIIPKE